jgi:hypothetical protein
MGDNPHKDITGLTDTTTYYYRVQVKNSTATVTSVNEITFDTLDMVHDVTSFNGLPSNTSISLNWVKPDGASKVLIRYDTTTYPATIVAGNPVYFDTSSSYVHTGLIAGRTYYYSIWGEDATVYSVTSKTLALTTLARSITTISGGDNVPAPVLPGNFNQPVNNTALSNFEPFYSIINDFADSWGMPNNTMWLIAILIGIGLIGVLILIETKHLMPAVFVSSMLMLGASFMQLLPSYFIAIAIMVSLGSWAMERGQGG